ncbi:MAG: hypothetical protein ABIW84_02325 [Ilumatobacteraceae bacterium]
MNTETIETIDEIIIPREDLSVAAKFAVLTIVGITVYTTTYTIANHVKSYRNKRRTKTLTEDDISLAEVA